MWFARMLGLSKRQEEQPPEETRPKEILPEIAISSKPEGRPEFKRCYAAQITDEVSVLVEMRWLFREERSTHGELKQRDSRRIWFDPERAADKILDPNLVTLVEDFCRRVFELDAEFTDKDPAEFTDEDGYEWVRKDRLSG